VVGASRNVAAAAGVSMVTSEAASSMSSVDARSFGSPSVAAITTPGRRSAEVLFPRPRLLAATFDSGQPEGDEQPRHVDGRPASSVRRRWALIDSWAALQHAGAPSLQATALGSAPADLHFALAAQDTSTNLGEDLPVWEARRIEQVAQFRPAHL
jgi:hypothetical protein